MTRNMTRDERCQQCNNIVEHLLEVYRDKMEDDRKTIEKLRHLVERLQRRLDRLEAEDD